MRLLRKPRSRSGFTLLELLVVVVLVAIVVAVVMPASYRGHGTNNRVRCASHLRQIGLAMMLYANENRGSLPFIRHDPGAPPTAYTGAMAADPFGADGPEPNDVTAALFLLVRTQDISMEVFVCWSSQAERWDLGDRTPVEASNFPSEQYLSYSFNNFHTPAGVDYPVYLRDIQNPDFVLAADMNPGTPELPAITPATEHRLRKQGNSYNHDRDGQNILYGDGHVRFQNTPLAGIKQDNIYTAGKEDEQIIIGPPTHAEDSILLPIASGPPVETTVAVASSDPSGRTIRFWVAGLLLLLTFGSYALIARRLRDRQPSPGA